MRQVRKPRQPDARSQIKRGETRRPSREGRGAAGRRDKPEAGGRGRFSGWLKALFSFRHPIFLMSFLLTVLVLVIAVLVSGVIGRTVKHVETSMGTGAVDAGFAVRAVTILGNQRTPKASVQAALGFNPGGDIFGIDLFDARARLLRLPWVAEAQVRRRYPGDIAVHIVEKQPFARWQGENGSFVIDREGGRITDHGVEAFGHLPLIAGTGAPKFAAEIVESVMRHPAVAARVTTYQYQSERRWNLLLDDGVTVKLPELGWVKQLDHLEWLIVKKRILEYDVKEIDLRDSNRDKKNYDYFRKQGSPPTVVKDTKGRAI